MSLCQLVSDNLYLYLYSSSFHKHTIFLGCRDFGKARAPQKNPDPTEYMMSVLYSEVISCLRVCDRVSMTFPRRGRSLSESHMINLSFLYLSSMSSKSSGVAQLCPELKTLSIAMLFGGAYSATSYSFGVGLNIGFGSNGGSL